MSRDALMRLPYYQVDAFTAKVFGGNPAGVCVLENWLPDDVLQSIAAENNLAETAFFTRREGGFDLRWFTPLLEVDLCGHATLATALVLFAELGFTGEVVRFHTRSGWLAATRRGKSSNSIFRRDRPRRVRHRRNYGKGLVTSRGRVLKARDFVAVYDTQAEVAALRWT